MADDIQMIYSDNPYIDVLVYNTKMLAFGTVIKNQTEADKYETLESLHDADMYIACVEHREYFELFIPYPEWLIREVLSPYMTENQIKYYLQDNSLIDDINLRKMLTERMASYILETYKDKNEYYRKLNGLPPLPDTSELKESDYIYVSSMIPDGVVLDEPYQPLHKLSDNDIDKLIRCGVMDTIKIIYPYEYVKAIGNFIYIPEDMLPDDIILSDSKMAVHLMSDYDIDVLNIFGILDKLKEMYPSAHYLNYLGYNKISAYSARKASNFDLLYVPNCEVEEIRKQYIDTYNKNNDFINKTVYSPAYKYQSDYYDSFIAVLITIQTMVDIITSVQINILKKEIFDSRTLRYLFESYGIPYYTEIPMKYQIAMIKNIHTLLKYKSTNRNIVDICSLFGFDNVIVFKYFLLKDVTISESDIGEVDVASELKFIKVPLNDNADNYIRDPSNYIDYDNIVSQDEFWNGDQEHDIIKQRIMDKEFSYIRTKYLSVDALCDLSEISFTLCYFFNLIYDNVKLEELLVLPVPSIKHGKMFKMVDLFCYLTALNFKSNIDSEGRSVVDTIMDSQEQVLYVKGFNFKADLAAISEYLAENHLSAELAGIAGFNVPETSVLTYKQLLEIFMDNKAVYNHIVKQLCNPPNKRIYDIYKKLYDSMLIIQYTNEYFKLPNGEIAKTYTEFLKYRDPTLFMELSKFDKIQDIELRRVRMIESIDQVVYALEDALDSDILKHIFRYFPSDNEEFIQRYIMKVINFFKSYKTQMLNMTIIYKIDDKLENTLRAIDQIADIISTFDLEERMECLEKLNIYTTLNFKDKAELLDKIIIEVNRLVSKNFDDRVSVRDDLLKLTYLDIKDKVQFMDELYKYMNISFGDLYNFNDKPETMYSLFNAKDSSIPFDKLSIEAKFD